MTGRVQGIYRRGDDLFVLLGVCPTEKFRLQASPQEWKEAMKGVPKLRLNAEDLSILDSYSVEDVYEILHLIEYTPLLDEDLRRGPLRPLRDALNHYAQVRHINARISA